MSDLYCVFGNPVNHSRSPDIHHAFAAQRGEDVHYEKREAPLSGFPEAVASFFTSGGRGANVTVPFKEEAYALCNDLSERARQAGAVNTLWQRDGRLHGDNTDGAGLMADLRHNLGWKIENRRVLLLGAGGAMRGILGPLLSYKPSQVLIANRTASKAQTLAELFHGSGVPVYGTSLDGLRGSFDLIINGISAGLHGEMPDLPADLVKPGSVAYDMVYGKEPTPFLRWAEAAGALATADGLGMLVEQAAEAFFLWRGWRPDTVPVMKMLRRDAP
ncbi:shikimate 5-dehydrogenase [Alcanivorax hongdengensis A-11-3]|uniref:Shikimate dehydrogenase (NADP(+)) n=1 Tax=Alcanivorax hongdengensis A-11-3 TaxID=1177179 RepID=L0WES2_9GAMM|nr:shikimate dehydrogenase [Alcanivorax hongdengensis]EKF74305.1 shikimate 5-dehydrogenase [Alcanivorax hongdengensis A-11-3]